eukprot:TRINITY_DN17114_c0_g1_i1.p2 TRINITY_DN17114_c0_g1~~TRINITY_DN17114_c0_g1_i1.p2  ORF type:complete len:745 (-),score=147.86 TRINITY_DN17114_c0_g1_i1:329-2563(-)
MSLAAGPVAPGPRLRGGGGGHHHGNHDIPAHGSMAESPPYYLQLGVGGSLLGGANKAAHRGGGGPSQAAALPGLALASLPNRGAAETPPRPGKRTPQASNSPSRRHSTGIGESPYHQGPSQNNTPLSSERRGARRPREHLLVGEGGAAVHPGRPSLAQAAAPTHRQKDAILSPKKSPNRSPPLRLASELKRVVNSPDSLEELLGQHCSGGNSRPSSYGATGRHSRGQAPTAQGQLQLMSSPQPSYNRRSSASRESSAAPPLAPALQPLPAADYDRGEHSSVAATLQAALNCGGGAAMAPGGGARPPRVPAGGGQGHASAHHNHPRVGNGAHAAGDELHRGGGAGGGGGRAASSSREPPRRDHLGAAAAYNSSGDRPSTPRGLAARQAQASSPAKQQRAAVATSQEEVTMDPRHGNRHLQQQTSPSAYQASPGKAVSSTAPAPVRYPWGHLPASSSRTVSLVSVATEQNADFRSYMEDGCKVVDPLLGGRSSQHSGGRDDEGTFGFFAVYDGHGGRHEVEYCEGKMHEVVLAELRALGHHTPSGKDVRHALTAAFAKIDGQLAMMGAWDSGCTATVCLVHRRHKGAVTLYIANVGDSRAVVVSETAARRLSVDHVATDPSEAQRVAKDGGVVRHGRVGGQLAVARSLGDHRLKSSGVSCVPDIAVCDASEGFALVMASDGLWDTVTDDGAREVLCTCVEGAMAEGRGGDERAVAEHLQTTAAKALVNRAKDRGSRDNILAMVMFL